MSDKPKSESHSEIWQRAIAEARKEPPQIVVDRAAIRAALRESRMRRTVRIRSHLP